MTKDGELSFSLARRGVVPVVAYGVCAHFLAVWTAGAVLGILDIAVSAIGLFLFNISPEAKDIYLYEQYNEAAAEWRLDDVFYVAALFAFSLLAAWHYNKKIKAFAAAREKIFFGAVFYAVGWLIAFLLWAVSTLLVGREIDFSFFRRFSPDEEFMELAAVLPPPFIIGAIYKGRAPPQGGQPAAEKPSEKWIVWGLFISLACAVFQAFNAGTILSWTSLFAFFTLLGIAANRFFPLAESGASLVIGKKIRISLFYAILLMTMFFPPPTETVGGAFLAVKIWGIIFGGSIALLFGAWFANGRVANEKPPVSYVFWAGLVFFWIYSAAVAYYLYGNEVPEMRQYKEASLIITGACGVIGLGSLLKFFVKK